MMEESIKPVFLVRLLLGFATESVSLSEEISCWTLENISLGTLHLQSNIYLFV